MYSTHVLGIWPESLRQSCLREEGDRCISSSLVASLCNTILFWTVRGIGLDDDSSPIKTISNFSFYQFFFAVALDDAEFVSSLGLQKCMLTTEDYVDLSRLTRLISFTQFAHCFFFSSSVGIVCCNGAGTEDELEVPFDPFSTISLSTQAFS